MKAADALKAYRAKRNFAITPEPAEGGPENAAARSFVIQKHWASRLHYDFRLELGGTMKSWAVPKGPSYDPHDKRMAVHVEDHPISYNRFEGDIPAGQYGAGKVIIWDKGVWIPLGDPEKDYRDGHIKFELRGHKLRGHWVLVRMKGRGEKQEPWLLIKEKDALARPADEFSVVDELPDSVGSLAAAPGAEAAPATEEAVAKGKRPAKKTAKKAAKKAAVKKTAAKTSGMPEGAVKAELPETFSPQLATLVKGPPSDGGDWLYEIKFDGYRLLARVQGKTVRLITRNGNDWTRRMPKLVESLQGMGLPEGWYDGEIVVPGPNGMPDFQALQGAFDNTRTQGIIYYLFDVPYCDGFDLRGVPLYARRELLKAMLERGEAPDNVRYSDTFEAQASDVVTSACRLGLEGVIGKRKDSTYSSRRSGDWIKLKCSRRQEFVIGGYTEPQGSRTGLGSLMLGVYDKQGKLHYAGNVGTGFNAQTLDTVKAKLDAAHATRSPFAKATELDRKANWVKPVLVAEVSFGEWTATGKIRHSVFHGLRTDKKASAIVRETPVDAPEPEVKSVIPDKLKVTHPERIVDATTGATKLDVIRYYALVAPLILEHLAGRPVSLVRAPDGITGELFFQKHMESARMPGVKQLAQAIDPDHPRYLEVVSAEGLLSAAQMNVLEFHTWNATKGAIAKPDRMTFDLDPGEGVPWSAVQEAAYLMRDFLAELELASFCKTSGGKGLHVVVPIRRRYGWDAVKGFSQAVVQHMAATLPKRFSAKSGPRNRVGKIFIDYLRNGFGATTVAAWSARSRPGLGISVPVTWDEVQKLSSGAHWKVGNAHTRLDRGNEPWHDYEDSAQNLTAAMRTLGYEPE